jgi:dihydroorotase (multifunctional complex type)
MTYDLAIRGGTLVDPHGRARLDLYVQDGRVAEVVPPQRSHSARETVDATGALVLPGMVDTHVHFMDPGDETREDFPSGSAGAAVNGVTTVVEHTHGWPVRTVDELAHKRAHLEGRSHVDFGLAAHVWPERIPELPALWQAGVTFFKAFTCETHGVPAITAGLMLEMLASVAQMDAVCLVHCEDDLICESSEKRLRALGRDDPGVLPAWRSREAEMVAVGTVATLARKTAARTGIAHVSSPDVLELIAARQSGGEPLVVESCPQYLLLREAEVLEHGSFRKFTPPARTRTDEDERRMWSAFNRGAIQLLSSDHAPSTAEQKRSGSIWDTPFGLPGIDTTFAVMLDAALTGRTSLERLVEAYSSVPARHYRLAGKGSLAPGADADVCIVDPHVHRTLDDSLVQSKAGWTPYAGREVRGAVSRTILRGRTVARDGAVEDSRGGRFLPGPGARAGS